MPKSLQLGFGAALAIGMMLCHSAIAAARLPEQQGTRGPQSHLLVNPHGVKSQPHNTMPGIRHQMPPRGFRGVPPDFHGALPRHAPPAARGLGGGPGRPSHDLGTFRGHDFAHLTPDELRLWQRGSWRRSYHRGHRGWWWVVGDLRFFYPSPIYPHPLYIGTVDYYDYYVEFGTPEYYWFFCSNPEGYYPYIQECRRQWHAVPPVPDAN